MEHASGDVHVKCADGTELTRDAVATAITTADAKFAVTEFTMLTPDPAPDPTPDQTPELSPDTQ